MDLFAVFIEQTQNIRNYTKNMPINTYNPSFLQSAIVLIGKQQDKYWVHSGNYIANSDLPSLILQLQNLNQLNKEELRRLYKSKLRQSDVSSTTGAGLGLIDMAKRMSEPFAYTVEKVDDQYSFFSICVTIY
jgi:hypothetical protein